MGEASTIDNPGDAVVEGWAVGVCGWQHRERQEVSDGKGGTQGTQRGCDFITEFIAPGCGYGRKGAGTRMLQDLKGLCEDAGGQEVHGYVWQGGEMARGWWDRRGMETT